MMMNSSNIVAMILLMIIDCKNGISFLDERKREKSTGGENYERVLRSK